MASKNEYLDKLKTVIEQLHNCTAVHVSTEPVREKLNGRTVWRGDVEVFDIFGNLNAKRCYAWSYLDGDEDKTERIVALLGIPPVDSAQKAVEVQILKDGR